MTLTDAINTFVAHEQERGLAYSTLVKIGSCLRRLRRYAGDCALTDLTSDHITKYLACSSPTVRWLWASNLEHFLEWASHTYKIVLPAVPYAARQPVQKPRSALGERLAAVRNDDALLQRALQLNFPHQRLCFLLGFVYGLPLEQVRQMTMQEIGRLPLREDLLQSMEQVAKSAPSQGAVFAPWFKGTAYTATVKVKRWFGVPFSDVLAAGERARIAAGIRPARLAHKKMLSSSDRLLRSLPELSEENVGRMPRLWT